MDWAMPYYDAVLGIIEYYRGLMFFLQPMLEFAND